MAYDRTRQFVFVYRGRLDRDKFNTERRLRKAGEFLLHCFETHTASAFVLNDDTKVHVNAQDNIIEFACTLVGVGVTEEALLVDYFKKCMKTLNSMDTAKFAQLGW